MRATEFIEELASQTGIDVTELQTVDKALVERGLRRKARGRAVPDVTTQEGLRLLLGVTGARRLTLAAEYVEAVQALRPVAMEDMRGKPLDTSLLEDWFEVSRDDLQAMPLIDVLLRVCFLLAIVDPENDIPPGTFIMEVSEHGASIQAQEIEPGRLLRSASLTFRIPGSPYPVGVHRISIVQPSVLHWIARNTKAEG